MVLVPGQELGHYVVLSPIAAGGMGEVYRARDTRLDREVAIKVLPDEVASRPDAVARFESEAKAVAALSHPGILALHDFGRVGGTTFAVAELLHGETLRSALLQGPLPLSRALDVAAQVADALAAAHALGIVHRDLKPENVFLSRGDRAKVLDFGIAVRAAPLAKPDEESDLPTNSVPGTGEGPPGTAAYMSPEHARGLAVGPASDQFSLGVVLYEMLSGARPFQGGCSVETLSSILRDEPAPLVERVPGIPGPVAWIVERCLRKRPEERYASTLDLAHDLHACLDRIRAGSGAWVRAGPPRREALWWPAAAVASVLAVLVLASLSARWAETAREARAYRELLARRILHRVTDGGFDATAPAVSPTGTEIAYVQRRATGGSDVFLRNRDGERTVDLTEDEPGEDREPAYSPDGAWIAFRSDRGGGGLFVVAPLGGAARRVAAFGHDPDWAPDGRRLAFATAATGSPGLRLGRKSALWVVDVTTGATVRLFEGDAMQPAVSPHGLRVAFWGIREGESRRDLATVPLEAGDGAPSPVYATDDEACDFSPFWSDDGRYLYFGSDRGGTTNLWRVRVDEETGEALEAPEPVPVPARIAGPFHGSADGRLVVYEARTPALDLERVPLGPSGDASGPGTPLVTDAEGMGEPRLSPEGNLLAFSSVRAAEDVRVIGTDGRGLRRVTSGPFRDRWPSFSSDGASLFFHSNRSGRFEMWRVRLDGSGLAPLTHRAGVQPFRGLASPDGRWLALPSSPAGATLVPADRSLDSAWPAPLPAPGEGLRFEVTSFSDDGRLLAGHAIGDDETYRGVFLYDLETKAYRRLTEAGSCPQLVLGGRRAYFLRQTALL